MHVHTILSLLPFHSIFSHHVPSRSNLTNSNSNPDSTTCRNHASVTDPASDLLAEHDSQSSIQASDILQAAEAEDGEQTSRCETLGGGKTFLSGPPVVDSCVADRSCGGCRGGRGE